jgi:glycosyltransferase involved in cell wall biosynthesis
LQSLRILKRIPLTLFLRADTIENHRIKGRPVWLIQIEHVLEGLGIAGTRMYGVSQVLTDRTMGRHPFFRPQKSGVLRNDIENIPEADKLAQKDWSLPLHLACVGVLEPRKNQRFLLEVMKEIPADKARLYLYGTGPDEEVLKKIVQEEHLADRVHFMGWMDSEKIWPKVDLLLMPSLHEGAPNAVLEAMGHGVPVLASDIPEHREILTETQLLSIADKGSWQKRIVFITDSAVVQLQHMNVCQKRNINSLLFDWDILVGRNVTEL